MFENPTFALCFEETKKQRKFLLLSLANGKKIISSTVQNQRLKIICGGSWCSFRAVNDMFRGNGS